MQMNIRLNTPHKKLFHDSYPTPELRLLNRQEQLKLITAKKPNSKIVISLALDRSDQALMVPSNEHALLNKLIDRNVNHTYFPS